MLLKSNGVGEGDFRVNAARAWERRPGVEATRRQAIRSKDDVLWCALWFALWFAALTPSPQNSLGVGEEEGEGAPSNTVGDEMAVSACF
jgi:hypothetical protein